MSVIYEPSGRAREYTLSYRRIPGTHRLVADTRVKPGYATNMYRGCDHGCIYCYAPLATRRKRDAFVHPEPRRDFLKKLELDAKRLKAIGDIRPVLLSFTCDPYQKLDVETGLTRETITILHKYGFPVHILTKGGHRALRDIDLIGQHPDDEFATTLTFLDPQRAKYWEPGAASTVSRVAALKIFDRLGVKTWVSLEPIIDPQQSLEIIKATYEYVDMYKIGKLNYQTTPTPVDWVAFVREAIELLRSLKKDYYLKASLVKLVGTDLLQGVTHG